MSTICMFGTCEDCGRTQYMQGPCLDCGGKVYQGGRKAFVEKMQRPESLEQDVRDTGHITWLQADKERAESAEVLAVTCHDHTVKWATNNWRKIPANTELVDRAHVTRLTAKCDGLLAEVDSYRKQAEVEKAFKNETYKQRDALKAEVEHLTGDLQTRTADLLACGTARKAQQSELTKAMELLKKHAFYRSDSGNGRCAECEGSTVEGHDPNCELGNFIAHQPAPSTDKPEINFETESRSQFEEMATVTYPGALALGRHPVHGTYLNSNLEKRWKGWLACDQFRAGIKPTKRGE